MESLGAGEIIINSIDNDGMMKVYDYELIDRIREAVNLLISALGGMGNNDDIIRLIERYGLIGASAGSMSSRVSIWLLK